MTEKTYLHKDNNLAPFNPVQVALDGSNLIEASAGTGKTYSIAILALRLLIEKEYSIKEILMVTFTKAAVAELEERIRLFVRQAVLVSEGASIQDETITQIVNQCTLQKSREKVTDLLNNALIFLDETSVMTIHSFCQQALREFAFETKQSFSAELLVDDSALISAGVNEFWREKITSMPLPLLQLTIDEKSRRMMADLIKYEQAGKHFYVYEPANEYPLNAAYYEKELIQFEDLKNQIQQEEDRLLARVEGEMPDLIDRMNSNHNAVKLLGHLTGDPKGFMLAILKNFKEKKYLGKLYKELKEDADTWNSLNTALEEFKKNLLNYIYCAAIQQISRYIKFEKEKQNQLSYDDLIEQLHQAITAPDHHRVVEGLQKKYKAVFIDEFQDTDRLQYEIFQKSFGNETIIFYIGDPKQSIYAFRRADIDTYLKASIEVDHGYGMNVNFRSSRLFIEGMNAFFLPEPGFDTFAFGNQTEQAFGYTPVKSPPENNKGVFLLGNEPEMPIQIVTSSRKRISQMALISQVANLLDTEQYLIEKPVTIKSKTDQALQQRRIVPADLGILVTSNADAKFYKTELSKRGIPAVVIGDDKILTSPEAVIVQYLLEAMLDLSRATINRALLNTLTGFNAADVIALTDTETIDRFKKYKSFWEKDGIYKALFSFVHDFEVHKHLLNNTTEAGERIITNLYQLIELLYKNQTLKNYALPEVVDWLKRGIEQGDSLGDEYTQRIESDSNSVTIMTIHKSKGLQFNIVLSSSLDMTAGMNSDGVIEAFKDPRQEYISVPKGDIDETLKALLTEQTQQENRRKLYVAVTRAVYKCYIFKQESKTSSALTPFIHSFETNPNPLISFKEGIILPKDYRYHRADLENDPAHSPETASKIGAPVEFNLAQKNWVRLSYTYLAAGGTLLYRKWAENHSTDYDYFIFHVLARGNKTGNMLHFIFEKIFFGTDNYWNNVIEEAIRKFAPARMELYRASLSALLTEVLNSEIIVGSSKFALSAIDSDHRMHEFEFDFPVNRFQPTQLAFLATESRQIQLINQENLEGLMNGKIDLLFEHAGKFYILDWKSTFLGNTLNYYTSAALSDAMNVHNYHLQYLIYTVAVKKYLASRIPDFDYARDFGGVIYVFLRGVRQGKDTGFYTVMPEENQVNRLERILSGNSQPILF